jgi:hypothetical protein
VPPSSGQENEEDRDKRKDNSRIIDSQVTETKQSGGVQKKK